jgi:hypothetical protein
VENFGIMTLHENNEDTYFTEIAVRAATQGITCCILIPSNINPTTLTVTGKIFDCTLNQWLREEFPLPQILYDRCFYGEDVHSKNCMSIVSWLKERKDVFFLGYGLPNKLDLYYILKQSPLSPYLPSTKLISQSKMVVEELSRHQMVVLKPINGSQGIGIYFIELQANKFYVKTFNRNQHIQKEFCDHKKFLSWINSLLAKKHYLIQPYLELTNEEYMPFDIRILLQKSAIGSWTERGRGVRIGHPDGIVSNLSAGGHIVHFDVWKDQFSDSKKKFIENEINDILSIIPSILEESFLPLFELGIDIGIARNGSIWILDINSKPGRKVILGTNNDQKEELYNAPLLYGRTLASARANERKIYDAKTLSY